MFIKIKETSNFQVKIIEIEKGKYFHPAMKNKVIAETPLEIVIISSDILLYLCCIFD